MKKVKATLLTVLLAAVAVAFTVYQFKPEPKYYVPHDVAQKQKKDAYPDQGIRGAIEYWSARKANQFTGVVDPLDVERGLAEAKMMARNKKGQLNWESMGPDNVGGRTRAIVVDKDDNRVLYSGGVSSGFFKSTNQGLSWRKTATTDNNMIVSMIQTSNGTIYFGTGEQFFTRGAVGDGNSGFMGNGIYMSTDKGETFSHLSTTSAASHPRWRNVNMLADDPRDANTFYAATMDGLMKTTDGGQTFSLLYAPAAVRVCSDLRVSPDGKTIFAVFQSIGQSSTQLYRSTDFGASFTEVGTTLTNNQIPRALSRLVIAIAPSDPNIVYAAAAKASDNKCEKIYRSTDNGDTWVSIGVGSDLFHPFSSSASSQGQGDYDNIIAVDPRNADRIFLGGVQFYTWSKTQGWLLSAGLTYFSGAFRNDNYIHADKHNIVFDTTVNPYIMYVTSDGGIAKSTNAQNTSIPTYGTITKNYVTTQFYSVAGSIRGEAIGGTQDNGTIMVDLGGLNGRTGTDVMGGDGGYAAISRINPDVYFAETQYGNLVRSLDRGTSLSEFWDQRIEASFPAGEYKAPFVTPFDLWEDYHNQDTQRTKFVIGMYSGIWYTEEALIFSKTPVWYHISPGINNISISCIEVAPDGKSIYFGSGSRLFRITGLDSLDLAADCDSTSGYCNGNNLTITQIFSSGGQTVTGMGIDPNNPNRMVVTLGNYGNTNYVYITNNAGSANPTFNNIQRNLPRVPVYDALISSRDSNIILLGTELGVYGAFDASSSNVLSWQSENDGIDDIAPVMMLDQVEQFAGQGSVIFIGTHGRGIYRTNVTTSIKPKPEVATNITLGPNPVVDFTTLRYELPKANDVTVSVYDMNGKLMSSERLGRQPAGQHSRSINAANYKSGIYFVTLSGDGLRSSVKMVVSK